MYLRLFLAGKQSGGYGYAAIQHCQREINKKHPFMYPQYWVSSIGGTYQDSRSFLSFRFVAGVTLQWFPCRSRTGISNIVTILYCAPVFFRRRPGSRFPAHRRGSKLPLSNGGRPGISPRPFYGYAV